MCNDQRVNAGIKKSQTLLINLGDCNKREMEVTFYHTLTGLGSVIGTLYGLSAIISSLQQLFQVEIMISTFFGGRDWNTVQWRFQHHRAGVSRSGIGNQIGLAVKPLPLVTWLYPIPKRRVLLLFCDGMWDHWKKKELKQVYRCSSVSDS